MRFRIGSELRFFIEMLLICNLCCPFFMGQLQEQGEPSTTRKLTYRYLELDSACSKIRSR